MIQKGFTLIELLVVIAILSILSTLGVANFRNSRIKALDAQRKADLQTIAKSLEAYVNDHHAYPTTDLPWGSVFTDGSSIYAARLPSDPASYNYVYVSDGSSYTLYAYLENAQDPARVGDLTVQCKTGVNCNYQLKSSNQL